MAQRYTMIVRKIWKDPWFRQLERPGKLLWMYLLTPVEAISRCGLIESDLETIAFESTCTLAEVQALLEQFTDAGKIYREGHCILIKNFMAYQCYNATLKTSCRLELEEWRERCPALVDAAEDILDGLQGEAKTKVRELTPAQAELQPLAQRCIALIHESCATGAGREPDNDLYKSVVALEQIGRIDKIPPEDIEKVLKWALEDDFWKGVMLAIPYWRKVSKQNGRPKFCNAWSAWRTATGQTGPRGARAGSDWSTP